jgi:hypothetical protein
MIYDPRLEYTEGLIFTSFLGLLTFFDTENTDFFRCIYRPLNDLDKENFFTFCSSLKNYLFIVDEVDTVSNANFTIQGLSDIINYGRHNDISVVACARRHSQISRLLTSQMDRLYCFNQDEPVDLDILEKRGFNREEIAKLPDFEYVFKEL